jgi:hypothetical protein
MKMKAFLLAGLAAAAFGAPALAHHSFAMFDADKTMEISGTVKDFQWTNPHSWLDVDVVDQAGKPNTWALEMGAPGGLAHQGWKPKTVVPGDKVTVRIHPLKSGMNGGQFLAITLPSGQKLGQDAAAPAAAAP